MLFREQSTVQNTVLFRVTILYKSLSLSSTQSYKKTALLSDN